MYPQPKEIRIRRAKRQCEKVWDMLAKVETERELIHFIQQYGMKVIAMMMKSTNELNREMSEQRERLKQHSKIRGNIAVSTIERECMNRKMTIHVKIHSEVGSQYHPLLICNLLTALHSRLTRGMKKKSICIVNEETKERFTARPDNVLTRSHLHAEAKTIVESKSVEQQEKEMSELFSKANSGPCKRGPIQACMSGTMSAPRLNANPDAVTTGNLAPTSTLGPIVSEETHKALANAIQSYVAKFINSRAFGLDDLLVEMEHCHKRLHKEKEIILAAQRNIHHLETQLSEVKKEIEKITNVTPEQAAQALVKVIEFQSF